MRVVSGQARGRSLSAPLPKSVRPTTDRVKESIFDIVGSMGGVAGLRVVDLFCGSGALGIEALSRGAAEVIFVDTDQHALDAVTANLASVGLDGTRATLVRAALPSYRPPAADLVLLDPPYDLTVVDEVLTRLEAAIVVLESRVEPVIDERWVLHRQRRYGGTLVTVLISHDHDETT
jgi:16S rRNA (guanine966-N2)-methyltransferase